MVPNNSEKPANPNVAFFNRWSEQRASYLLKWFDGLWKKSWVAFLALRPVDMLHISNHPQRHGCQVISCVCHGCLTVTGYDKEMFINLQISQIRRGRMNIRRNGGES